MGTDLKKLIEFVEQSRVAVHKSMSNPEFESRSAIQKLSFITGDSQKDKDLSMWVDRFYSSAASMSTYMKEVSGCNLEPLESSVQSSVEMFEHGRLGALIEKIKKEVREIPIEFLRPEYQIGLVVIYAGMLKSAIKIDNIRKGLPY